VKRALQKNVGNSTATDYQSGDLSILPLSIMSNADPLKNTSIRMDAVDHVLGGTSTIVGLLKDLSSLIPQAGPLAQVLGVTKELVTIINQMRDNGAGCSHLAERILKFLKDLSEESARLNEPIRDGSPTALRLMKLES